MQEAVASVGLYRCDVALVVTNSRFTEQARKLADANKVSLWDREVLLAKILAADAAPQAPTAEPRCAACGREVSERVVAYCRAHTDRFGGQTYCYDHQRGEPGLAAPDAGF